MDCQTRLVREYRAIFNGLAKLTIQEQGQVSAILRKLQMGWLTPGSVILQRIEDKQLSLRKVLRRPDSLQRKWFDDLNELEKGRWITIFRGFCGDERMQAILQLTLRRLQQLQKKTKSVSQGTDT